MEAKKYLSRIEAAVYFNDAASLAMRTRPERPVEFLVQYFSTASEMSHVVFRDFEFVNATPWNRQAFCVACHRAFGHFEDSEDICAGDIFQLASLLCPTIPEARVTELPRLLRLDPTSKAPFGVLATAFFVHFSYYDDLLELRQLFVVQSPQKRLEWRSVDFAAVAEFMSVSAVSNLPLRFVREAFDGVEGGTEGGAFGDAEGGAEGVAKGDPEGVADSGGGGSLTFDELVLRLLGSRGLARYAREGLRAVEWQPRDAHDDVADLFLRRNGRGETAAEDGESGESGERLVKAPKAKPKDKGKPKKAKP